MTATNRLAEELEYFNEKRAEWLLIYRGQFALIKGKQLFGTYTTHEQAFNAGIQKVGNQPFLIKEVKEVDDTVMFPALTVGVLVARPR